MEVVRLALHGPDTGVLEVEPAVLFIVFAGALRVGDLVVFVVLFRQVGEDAAGFEEADLGSVSEGVGQGGDAAVGVDFEEPSRWC